MTETPTAQLSTAMAPETDFDHGSPHVVADRPAAFKALRDLCPVVHSSQYGGFYALTSWHAVNKASTSPALFSSQPRALIPMYPEPMGMLDLDPPVGPEIRKQLTALFDKASGESTRARTREVTNAQIDTFIETGSADLIRDLMGPVSATMTAEGMGLPVDQAVGYATVFHDLLCGPSEEDMPGVLARLEAFLDDLRAHIEDRKQTPREDWLTALVQLEVAGERSDDELALQNAHLLFSGGVDTTAEAMAQSVVHLNTDHELRDRISADPSVLPGAVDEFLRFYTPFVCSARTVTADTELEGVRLAGGERAMLTWAAANRDPVVFEEPDEFRVDRKQNRHLAFGAGNHKCLGQHLARSRSRRSCSRCAPDCPTSSSTRTRSSTTPATSWPG